MRRLTHAQLQNLVYIGIVTMVAAGIMIYVMMRGEPVKLRGSEETPAPSATFEPETEKEAMRFEAAPVSVVLAQLENDTRLHVEKRAEDEYCFRLLEDSDSEGAVLRMTEAGGLVSSFSWTFLLPAEPVKKPKSDIEKRLNQDYDAALASLRERMDILLPVAMQAGDLNSKLREPVLRIWCEGAFGTAQSGKIYRNTEVNCSFIAYVTEKADVKVLECVLLLP